MKSHWEACKIWLQFMPLWGRPKKSWHNWTQIWVVSIEIPTNHLVVFMDRNWSLLCPSFYHLVLPEMLADSLWKKPETKLTSEGKLLIRHQHFWTGWKPSGQAVLTEKYATTPPSSHAWGLAGEHLPTELFVCHFFPSFNSLLQVFGVSKLLSHFQGFFFFFLTLTHSGHMF